MIQRYIYLIFILWTVLFPGDGLAATSSPTKKKYHVLYIQSSDNGYLMAHRKTEVEKAFHRADIPVEVSYLQLRTHDVDASYSMNLLLENLDRYRQNPPDVILAFNDDALNFLMASEDSLVLQTPMVFSNVVLPLPIMDKYPQLTGQLETVDYRQAYELGKRLFGEIDELQIAYGFQREDFLLADTAKAQLKDIPEFTFFRDYVIEGPENAPLDTVRDPATVARPLTIGFDVPTVWRRDQFSRYYQHSDSVRHIGIKARGEHIYPDFLSYQLHPFIGVTHSYFRDEGFPKRIPHGVIGGYFNTFDRQIDKAVETCLRILHGEPASSIPVDTGLRTPVFDWELLQYWGIPESRLPEGSRIVNQPFYLKYAKALTAGAVFGTLLILFFGGYLLRVSKEIRSRRNSSIRKLQEEQERIRTTVNAVSNGIISLDCRGMIVSINPAAQKLLGLDENAAALQDKHISSFLKLSPRYKHDSFWLEKLVARAAETHQEQPLPEGSLLELHNGSSLQISGIIRSLYINSTRIGTLFTFRDCTDKLRQAQFLEFSMEAGDVYTWQIDSEKQTIAFHPSFFANNGLDRETPQMGKKEFVALLHPDDRRRWLRKIVEVRENARADKYKVQVRLKLPKGYVWFEFGIASMPVATEERKNTRLFGICLSIQKLKETEAVMRKVLEEAKESNRLKLEFLANMSHEIRTPLNAIVGFSTLINEVEEEEKVQFVELIGKNCDTLLQTINDILDISRVESGYPFQYKVCQLKKLLSEIWSEEQPLFADTRAEFFLELAEDECLLETDPFRLKQLAVQLLRNARRFTAEGSVTLGYSYQTGHEYVEVYVRDTGIGIAPEDREIVFERFYKLDKFTTGGGLGLSLCKEIAKRFGGTIRIDDGLQGKGTCVVVTLPVHQVQPKNEQI